MNIKLSEKPRTFEVGNIVINDYGKIALKPWDMIAVMTENGRECDISATDWGFYLGSSLNSRMRKEGFKVALVKNPYGKVFVNAVEEDKIYLFEKYLVEQKSTVVMWLDEEQ